MINSVLELQSIFLSKGALESDPIFRRPYMMDSPGCSEEKINILLEKIPELPKSYLGLVSLYSLNGVIVDNFELSPQSFRNKDIVEGLIQAYEDPFFPKEFMEKHKMYQIGSYNIAKLCVTSGSSQFKEGEILFIEEGYDINNPQNSQIHRLAKDFEQFLIVAGNLDQIHSDNNEDNSNWEEKKAEFIERLKILGVSEEYHPTWLSMF